MSFWFPVEDITIQTNIVGYKLGNVIQYQEKAHTWPRTAYFSWYLKFFLT